MNAIFGRFGIACLCDLQQSLRRVLLILSLVTMSSSVLAATDAASIHWWDMGMKLFGGLALFLFGMDQMADALKAVAGDRMKNILARLTTNRIMGAATGALVTAVIQSSSVTTVLVVGFITAGLMSMSQSIGVIMGANIGTTITAQIVAFKVTKAALLMVAVGFGMLSFSRQEKIKHYGGMLMGLGMVFFGMSVMSEAMKPLRDFQPFLDLMAHMESPIVGILIAAAFTGLIQSSSATTGIVIVMASQGFITLPAGIALAFGANIGTCVTAMLASIGKPREALRAAMVHVLFNVFGVMLWFGFITYLASFVTWLSPSHPELSGINRLAAETPRQIANAHTVFNVANTFIFIGFAGQFARLVEWLIPDKPIEEIIVTRPKYLADELLDTPSLALGRVRLEIGHIGERVKAMLDLTMPAIVSGDKATFMKIADIDEEVDALHGHIVTYLANISKQSLTENQTTELMNLMSAVNDLENIGDIIETDIIHLGNERLASNLKISRETEKVLSKLNDVITTMTELAIDAVMTVDKQGAHEIIAMKDDINKLIDSASIHQIDRLTVNEPNRLALYTIEIDTIEKFKRIYYFAKRIAKSVMTANVEPEQDSTE